MKVLQNRLHKWQVKTFPESTPLAKLEHLKKEIEEVERALRYNDSKDILELELADCALLLFGIAGLKEVDLIKACKKKLKINKKRKWNKPVNGVYFHKK
jgi:NTP pyrophosphatase (non-canonical NTP hydrolase)